MTSKSFSNSIFIKAIIVVFSLNLPCVSMAQEEKQTNGSHHQVSLVVGHTTIFDGKDENGDKQVLFLPSWGIDYTYYFKTEENKPTWGIGLHTDIITETFKVTKNLDSENPEEEIERTNPIAPAIMGIYKTSRHWAFLLGFGEEFAKEENLTFTRAGIEYGAEISAGWEVFGSFNYDFKWNAYDSWTLGIGIAKKL
ncbi:hypothetical protein ACSVH2_06380 [Flavobacterium sp. RSB2_4_14]|uniref:hypothetical protein n=1 Tax=Flavobacterium sp. RSB2_4_14 TaxID=3447665 RepID=UPI003F319FCC